MCRASVCAAALGLFSLISTNALPASSPSDAELVQTNVLQSTNGSAYPLDLPTALRLAGARNLDIQIARAGLKEAEANRQGALEQFFPWIAPGIGYHRRDGVAQAVPSGVISDAHFQSYSPGASLNAQLVLGDAIYNSLASKQLLRASEQTLEADRLGAILAAANGYFDMVRAKALVEVTRQSIQILKDYREQLHEAVAAGIAFKGDELRVQTQQEQSEILLQQAAERQRVAAVNLAQVLHLDSRVELVPLDPGLTPVKILPERLSMNALVDQALRTRPELKRSEAVLAASRADRNGARYGPLIPTIGAQVFAGGLGGGPDGGPGNLAAEGDYTLGLSWRIGPGGLFDPSRAHASKARFEAAEFTDSKLKDTITSQVVAALVRVDSTATQIEIAQRNLKTAADSLELARQRKRYGVGIVLEAIQAEQALTQARADYVTAVAEHDKAQYALSYAVGEMPEATAALKR